MLSEDDDSDASGGGCSTHESASTVVKNNGGLACQLWWRATHNHEAKRAHGWVGTLQDQGETESTPGLAPPAGARTVEQKKVMVLPGCGFLFSQFQHRMERSDLLQLLHSIANCRCEDEGEPPPTTSSSSSSTPSPDELLHSHALGTLLCFKPERLGKHAHQDLSSHQRELASQNPFTDFVDRFDQELTEVVLPLDNYFSELLDPWPVLDCEKVLFHHDPRGPLAGAGDRASADEQEQEEIRNLDSYPDFVLGAAAGAPQPQVPLFFNEWIWQRGVIAGSIPLRDGIETRTVLKVLLGANAKLEGGTSDAKNSAGASSVSGRGCPASRTGGRGHRGNKKPRAAPRCNLIFNDNARLDDAASDDDQQCQTPTISTTSRSPFLRAERNRRRIVGNRKRVTGNRHRKSADSQILTELYARYATENNFLFFSGNKDLVRLWALLLGEEEADAEDAALIMSMPPRPSGPPKNDVRHLHPQDHTHRTRTTTTTRSFPDPPDKDRKFTLRKLSILEDAYRVLLQTLRPADVRIDVQNAGGKKYTVQRLYRPQLWRYLNVRIIECMLRQKKWTAAKEYLSDTLLTIGGNNKTKGGKTSKSNAALADFLAYDLALRVRFPELYYPFIKRELEKREDRCRKLLEVGSSKTTPRRAARRGGGQRAGSASSSDEKSDASRSASTSRSSSEDGGKAKTKVSASALRQHRAEAEKVWLDLDARHHELLALLEDRRCSALFTRKGAYKLLVRWMAFNNFRKVGGAAGASAGGKKTSATASSSSVAKWGARFAGQKSCEFYSGHSRRSGIAQSPAPTASFAEELRFEYWKRSEGLYNLSPMLQAGLAILEGSCGEPLMVEYVRDGLANKIIVDAKSRGQTLITYLKLVAKWVKNYNAQAYQEQDVGLGGEAEGDGDDHSRRTRELRPHLYAFAAGEVEAGAEMRRAAEHGEQEESEVVVDQEDDLLADDDENVGTKIAKPSRPNAVAHRAIANGAQGDHEGERMKNSTVCGMQEPVATAVNNYEALFNGLVQDLAVAPPKNKTRKQRRRRIRPPKDYASDGEEIPENSEFSEMSAMGDLVEHSCGGGGGGAEDDEFSEVSTYTDGGTKVKRRSPRQKMVKFEDSELGALLIALLKGLQARSAQAAWLWVWDLLREEKNPTGAEKESASTTASTGSSIIAETIFDELSKNDRLQSYFPDNHPRRTDEAQEGAGHEMQAVEDFKTKRESSTSRVVKFVDESDEVDGLCGTGGEAAGSASSFAGIYRERLDSLYWGSGTGAPSTSRFTAPQQSTLVVRKPEVDFAQVLLLAALGPGPQDRRVPRNREARRTDHEIEATNIVSAENRPRSLVAILRGAAIGQTAPARTTGGIDSETNNEKQNENPSQLLRVVEAKFDAEAWAGCADFPLFWLRLLERDDALWGRCLTEFAKRKNLPAFAVHSSLRHCSGPRGHDHESSQEPPPKPKNPNRKGRRPGIKETRPRAARGSGKAGRKSTSAKNGGVADALTSVGGDPDPDADQAPGLQDEQLASSSAVRPPGPEDVEPNAHGATSSGQMKSMKRYSTVAKSAKGLPQSEPPRKRQRR